MSRQGPNKKLKLLNVSNFLTIWSNFMILKLFLPKNLVVFCQNLKPTCLSMGSHELMGI